MQSVGSVSGAGEDVMVENEPDKFEGRITSMMHEAMRIGVFRPTSFRASTGLQGSDVELFAQLMETGGRPEAGTWIEFEADFYLSSNPDVREAGVNPLVHYVEHGWKEGRYPTQNLLRRDVVFVEQTGMFDFRGYGSKVSDEARRMGLIEHYLTSGWREGLEGIVDFEDRFYYETFQKSLEPFFVPAIHHLKLGIRLGLPKNSQEFAVAANIVERSEVFDQDYYSVMCGREFATRKSAVTHYLSYGMLNGIPCAAEFNQVLYLKSYADIQAAGVLPIIHYIESGKEEGRMASISSSYVFKPGSVSIDPGKPNLLIACHEASATGAPLLGLALIKDLKEDFNVITLLHHGGAIFDEFAKVSVLIGDARDSLHDGYRFLLEDLNTWMPIDFAIANSVECEEINRAAADLAIPSITLLHEFAEYTRPQVKVAGPASCADAVVTPAEIVKQSFVEQNKVYYNGSPRNVLVRHQGRVELPRRSKSEKVDVKKLEKRFGIEGKKRPKIVMGAGYVQPRKGVDLFIQTAVALRAMTDDDYKFVWVGGGWNPKDDMGFSVWQNATIEAAGLEDMIEFVDELPDLDWVFDNTDVFYLPSRLDPFPNVAIDAFIKRVPVVCYDNATGIAEFIKDLSPSSRVVPHSDCSAAAKAILEISEKGKKISESEAKGILKALDWSDYVNYLKDLMVEIRSRDFDPEVDRDRLPVSDPEFLILGDRFRMDPTVDLRRRKKSLHNGIFPFEFAPGYDPALGKEVPVGGAEWSEPILPSHTVLRMPITRTTAPDNLIETDKKIAIQIHMHYEDLSPELAEQFAPFAECADFYISTSGKEKIKAIEDAFDDFKSVKIAVGDNVGRDVGPLITLFKDDLSKGGYDIIGHFHSKKSLETAGEDLGKKWRTYLYKNLVGNAVQAQWIVDQFSLLPNLGLLFPESRHIMGWNENFDHAQELLERIGFDPMPARLGIRFPVGTMFWGSPKILEPYWKADIKYDEYPPEPLPVDGSILHAFERLLPVVCERQGLDWATVYRADIEQW